MFLGRKWMDMGDGTFWKDMEKKNINMVYSCHIDIY